MYRNIHSNVRVPNALHSFGIRALDFECALMRDHVLDDYARKSASVFSSTCVTSQSLPPFEA